jgi:hypothetical protein
VRAEVGVAEEQLSGEVLDAEETVLAEIRAITARLQALEATVQRLRRRRR